MGVDQVVVVGYGVGPLEPEHIVFCVDLGTHHEYVPVGVYVKLDPLYHQAVLSLLLELLGLLEHAYEQVQSALTFVQNLGVCDALGLVVVVHNLLLGG